MNPEFQVHKLTPDGIEKAKVIACKFDELLCSLVALLPAGRHLAVTRTKLEEACFFAKKAMASDPANQEPIDPRD